MTIEVLVSLLVAILAGMVGFIKLCWDMLKDVRAIKKEQNDNTSYLATSRRTLKDVAAQVKNTHDVNLRDDLDNKHNEIITRLMSMDNRFMSIEGRLHDERQSREQLDERALKEHSQMWSAINRIRNRDNNHD